MVVGLSLPLGDSNLQRLSVTGESWHRDEHRLSAGTAAGYQHVGTRVLRAGQLPVVGGPRRRRRRGPARQRYQHHCVVICVSSQLENSVACRSVYIPLFSFSKANGKGKMENGHPVSYTHLTLPTNREV